MSIVTEQGTIQVEVVKDPKGWRVFDVDTGFLLGQFDSRIDAIDLAVYVNNLVAELETRIENAEQETRDIKHDLRHRVESFTDGLDIW